MQCLNGSQGQQATLCISSSSFVFVTQLEPGLCKDDLCWLELWVCLAAGDLSARRIDVHLQQVSSVGSASDTWAPPCVASWCSR